MDVGCGCADVAAHALSYRHAVNLLDVEDLRVTLQTARGPADALRGVSFSLPRGGTLGLIGESGCGKSITALALMGLLPDSATVSGSLRFDGRELVGLAERDWCRLRGNRLAMVFQEPMTALNPLHTIGQQIGESLRLHKRLDAAQPASRPCACCSGCSCRRPRSGWAPTRTSSQAASGSGW